MTDSRGITQTQRRFTMKLVMRNLASCGLFSFVALAGCHADPAAEDEMAWVKWRDHSREMGLANLPDGRQISWPLDRVISCGASAPPEAAIWPRCVLELNKLDGRAKTLSVGYDINRLTIALDLDPRSYPSAFAIARGNDSQWNEQMEPAFPPNKPYEGEVRGRLGGSVQGHQYWVGCWRFFDAYPYNYGCTMALDLAVEGSAVIDFETPEPDGSAIYRPDVAEVERLARMVILIRASLDEPNETAEEHS